MITWALALMGRPPASILRARRARGALRLAGLRLAGGVEQQVVGHDHVGVGADAQAARVDLARAQRVELVGQDRRIDDDAVADDAALAGIEDPRRDEVELEDLTVA